MTADDRSWRDKFMDGRKQHLMGLGVKDIHGTVWMIARLITRRLVVAEKPRATLPITHNSVLSYS